MPKKLAEITMNLECGGTISTFIPCKNEKDLRKKLSKVQRGKWNDFGSFKVKEDSILYSGFKIHEVH